MRSQPFRTTIYRSYGSEPRTHAGTQGCMTYDYGTTRCLIDRAPYDFPAVFFSAVRSAPMGCAASNPDNASFHGGTASVEAAAASRAKSPYGPLSSEQYQSRLAHSGSVRETKVALHADARLAQRSASHHLDLCVPKKAPRSGLTDAAEGHSAPRRVGTESRP